MSAPNVAIKVLQILQTGSLLLAATDTIVLYNVIVSCVLRGDNQNIGPTIPHIFMINSLLHQQMNVFVWDHLLPQSSQQKVGFCIAQKIVVGRHCSIYPASLFLKHAKQFEHLIFLMIQVALFISQ